jgi:competence protein ComEC
MVAPYSTAANIISAPLISVISVSGIISALGALISPVAGSALASLLYYPTQLLIVVVQFFSQLPGSSLAVGTISLFQLLLLYGLIGISCLSSRVRRRWWLVALVAVTLVALPVWQTKTAQFRVTVLATAQEQVLVIQDRGKVTLINSGEADTASFTVLPFLQQQGINQIDWAVALDSQPRLRKGWFQMLESLPIKAFYDNNVDSEPQSGNTPPKDATVSHSAIAKAVQSQQGNYKLVSTGQTTSLGATLFTLINAEPLVLQLQIQHQTWLVLGEIKPDVQKQLATTGNLPPVQVLWWTGGQLMPELLEALQAKVAIASSNTLNPEAAQLLRNNKTLLYWTGRDGAIQWTPNTGFETTLETSNNDASLL